MAEQRGAVRRGGRGIRPWLLLVKLAGLVLFLGGLAVMSVVGLTQEPPATLEGWLALRGVLHGVVLGCMLPGVAIAALAGVLLLLQHPRMFLHLRWFRLKLAMIVLATPVLHLWARGRTLTFDQALAEGRLDELPARWRAIVLAFLTALLVYLLIAAIGRSKPRLGEPAGSRIPR